jgi:hypothetical protein
MPLEMVDDPQDQNNNNSGGNGGGGFSGGGSGGGGGLFSLIPLVFSLFRGGGKGTIFILLLVVGGYFLLKNQSCNNLTNLAAQYARGGILDPNQFSKASVYEGLEDDDSKNPLPESVSLLKYAPDRKNQGQQGSCVAWSSVYAARTIIESSSTGQDPNTVAYSPAFVYNQIGEDNCQGALIEKAMGFMTTKGVVQFNDFPYDENDCSRQPANNIWDEASQNRMHGFNRLTDGEGVNKISLRAIKEHLSKNAPVVIGMMVGGSFMQDMMGKKVWIPTNEDYAQNGFGGHALCVIGYDDALDGGAFQIMNSWGTEWGENGIAYVRYSDFPKFVREAYGIDPMPKRGAELTKDFECTIGLVNNDTKQYIPLKLGNGNTFNTVEDIKRGTRFKIEIKNAIECYIYLFTPDASGNSFVLFPYKPIHSPYCGITGYRLFPRAQSIRADSLGNKDYMGIVVSKDSLNYAGLNNAINNSTQSTYAGKLNEAIGDAAIHNVQYNNTDNGCIYFKSAATETKNIISCVVEINKQ